MTDTLNRIYLAGPITGIPEYNKPAFDKAAAAWRKAGWEVVNPLELDDGDYSQPWHFYLRRDIPHLVTCDAIAILPGSEFSKGARLERHIAEALGMPVFGAGFTHKAGIRL